MDADNQPPRKKLKKGSYVKRTVAKLTIGAADSAGEVETKLIKNKLCKGKISWHIRNDGHSTPLPNSEGQYGAVFFGSNTPFKIEKVVMSPWSEYGGQTFFRVQPLPDPNKAFPLLRLPTELRLMVYKEALVCKNMIHVADDKPGFRWIRRTGKESGSLLMVNRQIYVEAMPVFYSGNQLCFDNTRTAVKFINNLGVYAHSLRRVGISWIWFIGSGVDMMDLLATIPMKEICLLEPAHLDVRKVARSVKGWFRHRASSENEVDALLSLIRIGRCWACLNMIHSVWMEEPFAKVCDNQVEHDRLKEDLAKLIDDEILA
ncbi:Hypothetical protein D9617_24g016960 [Elsinoe fawcettii]|nr:Hypothetical protein D9617_24g016960 [Elsinoe fawcettii]